MFLSFCIIELKCQTFVLEENTRIKEFYNSPFTKALSVIDSTNLTTSTVDIMLSLGGLPSLVLSSLTRCTKCDNEIMAYVTRIVDSSIYAEFLPQKHAYIGVIMMHI